MKKERPPQYVIAVCVDCGMEKKTLCSDQVRLERWGDRHRDWCSKCDRPTTWRRVR